MIKQPRLLLDAPEAERWRGFLVITRDSGDGGGESVAGIVDGLLLLSSKSEDVSYLGPSNGREGEREGERRGGGGYVLSSDIVQA